MDEADVDAAASSDGAVVLFTGVVIEGVFDGRGEGFGAGGLVEIFEVADDGVAAFFTIFDFNLDAGSEGKAALEFLINTTWFPSFCLCVIKFLTSFLLMLTLSTLMKASLLPIFFLFST